MWRPHSIRVSIGDSGSLDLSSNLGGTKYLFAPFLFFFSFLQSNPMLCGRCLSSFHSQCHVMHLQCVWVNGVLCSVESRKKPIGVCEWLLTQWPQVSQHAITIIFTHRSINTLLGHVTVFHARNMFGMCGVDSQQHLKTTSSHSIPRHPTINTHKSHHVETIMLVVPTSSFWTPYMCLWHVVILNQRQRQKHAKQTMKEEKRTKRLRHLVFPGCLQP